MNKKHQQIKTNKLNIKRVWESWGSWSPRLCLEGREMYCKGRESGNGSPEKSPLSRGSVLENLLWGCLCCMLLSWDLTRLWWVLLPAVLTSADLLAAPSRVCKRRKVVSILHCMMVLTDRSHCVLWKLMCVARELLRLSSAKFDLVLWNVEQKLREADTKSFAWKEVLLQCHIWWCSGHTSKLSLALICLWVL